MATTTITGDKTDETFTAMAGVTYNGQGGVDTLVFTGVYDDYSILLKDTGNIKTVVSWDDGSVDTKWIERFVFADGVYDVTTDLFEPNTPPPPTFISVVATDGVGTEASGDEPDFTFTFTRTGDTSQALTVNYSVAGAPPTFPITFNAAQPGADIAAQSGTITFAANSATAVLSFNAIDDALVEIDEKFYVSVQPGGGYEYDMFGPNLTAVGTIIDNDVAPPPPTISISDCAAVEGQPVTFTISLSHATDHIVTVTYATQGGTAAGMGNDFFGTPGTTGTFAPGQVSAEISIQTRNETLVEPNEQFFVNLSNPTGGTIADGQGVGIILNDDIAQPHITITAVQSAVVEGGTISYLFQRTGGDLNSAFDVSWDYLPPLPSGAATPGVDFVEPASKVIHFAAGQTQAVLNFATIADGVYEGTSPALPSTEAFAISFVPDGSYTFTVVSNIATIVDGDAPPALPTISVSQDDAVPGAFGNVVHEGDDVTFTFTRTGSLANELIVEFQINSSAFGSAELGSDFEFLPDYAGGVREEPFTRPDGSPTTLQIGSVTFAAGSDTVTLTLHTEADGVAEGQPLPPGFDFETFSFGVWPGDATTYLTDLAHSSVSVQLQDSVLG